MQELSPETVTFGKHVPCPRCRTPGGKGRKPHNRGWVWVTNTLLLSTDKIIEHMPSLTRKPTQWYRIECRVCHGKGYTEHAYVAERVGDV